MINDIKQSLESEYLALVKQGKVQEFISEHEGIKVQIENYGELQRLGRTNISRILLPHDEGYFYIFPDQGNLTQGFVVPVIRHGNRFSPMEYSILRTLFDIRTVGKISEDFRISKIGNAPLYTKVNNTWVGNHLGLLTIEAV